MDYVDDSNRPSHAAGNRSEESESDDEDKNRMSTSGLDMISVISPSEHPDHDYY